MSGYPYGGPPPTQPYGGGGYGTSPAGYGIPYGVGAPSAAGEKPSKSHKVGDYHPSAPPSSATYAAAASQYSGVEPSKTGYQPSAPPAAGPYGGYVDPYSAGSEKPSKAQQGGGYDVPYSEKPSKAQKGGGYGDSYSEKPSKPQQGTVTPTAATDSINSPEGFLLEWWSVFWDIFIARTNEKHSPAAAAYIEEQRSKARQQNLDFKHQQDQLRRRHANYPALNGAMVPLSSNGQAAKIRQEVQGTCGQQILERMHNPTDIKGQLGVAQRSLHDPSLIYGQGFNQGDGALPLNGPPTMGVDKSGPQVQQPFMPSTNNIQLMLPQRQKSAQTQAQGRVGNSSILGDMDLQ